MASTEDDVVVRLRLKDVRQFIEDVKAGKLAIEDLEKKVKKAGQTAARESSSSGGFGKLASHFGFLKYAAIGAVGSMAAAAGGVVGYAVKSAASLEQVTVGFTTMLHSASKAKDMVASLQTFAQRTPFNLSDVETATQQLLAFRFTAQSIIPTLTAVGDAVSANPSIGTEGFQRIILALGQMKSMGSVQGGEVLQLEQAGINVRSYLEQGLHLTPKQLESAMRKNSISSAAAIPIILRGMEKDFKGMMAKESHTLTGMWSNFHDAMQQGLIKLANPFMPAMKKWLGEATTYLGGPDGKSGLFARAAKFMAVLPGNITSGRADFAAYNIGAILGNHGLDPAIEKGVRVVYNLGVIVKDVLVPAFKDLSFILAPVVLIFDHLDSITGFVAEHKTVFKVLAEGVLAVVGAFKLYQLVMVGVNTITGIFDALADANPIGLIVVAIAALAAGFIYAYTHSVTFRRFIDDSWRRLQAVVAWIRENWETLALFTPFTMAIRVVHDHWGEITNDLDAVRQWINTYWPGISAILIKPFQDLIDNFHTVIDAYNNTLGRVATGPLAPAPGQPGWMTAASFLPPVAVGKIIAKAVGHADGGVVTQGHAAWVGERGPELVNLPRGSQVIPLPRVPEFAGGSRHIEIPVVLNGREIARAVYDDMDDRMARR